MVYINDLQRETLLLADKLIDDGKTFDEILYIFSQKGYALRVPVRNGYTIKTRIALYKDGQCSFVDIKKRRNGLALWETIKLS